MADENAPDAVREKLVQRLYTAARILDECPSKVYGLAHDCRLAAHILTEETPSPGAQAPLPELALELQERIREAKGLGVSSHAQPTKVQLGGVIRTVILLEEHIYKLEAALATERESATNKIAFFRELLATERAAHAETSLRLEQALADLHGMQDGSLLRDERAAREEAEVKAFDAAVSIGRLRVENAALRKSLDGAREALADRHGAWGEAAIEQAIKLLSDAGRALPAEPAKAEGG